MASAKQPGFLLKFISIIFIPVLLLFFTLAVTLTSPRFYTGLLKRANLVSVIARSGNRSIENSIAKELEKYPEIEECKDKLQTIKEKLVKLKTDYNKINKTDEYNALILEKEEIEDMEYNRVFYNSRSEFRDKKEQKEEKIEAQMEKIEELRELRQDALEDLQERMAAVREQLVNEQEKLAELEENVLDIKKEKRNSKIGRFYQDLDIVSPYIEEALNSFFDQELNRELTHLFEFISSYEKQKKQTNIYFTTSRAADGSVAKQLNIRLPDFYFNLHINDNVEGAVIKRHLFDEILPERINKVRDQLHNPGYFKMAFRLSDNRLIENLISRYIKDFNMEIKRGMLHIKPVTLTGDNAAFLLQIMKHYRTITIVKYLLLVLALLLFIIFMYASRGPSGRARSFVFLFYRPSLILVSVMLLMWLFAGTAVKIILPDMAGGLTGAYLGSGARSFIFNLFFLSGSLFITLLVISFIIRKFILKKQAQEEPAPDAEHT
ncbi:MAG TPA: hypothetical protein VKS21_01710 [Spirochaetota bacterium]|nr:hypothetical protein [Spirochaetota bacterium]